MSHRREGSGPGAETVYVVGASTSGCSVARHCLARGDRVLLSDRDPRRRLPRALAPHPRVELRTGDGHERACVDAADRVVLSPGVARDGAAGREALRKGRPLWSAIEFAAAELAVPTIVVTGSSGKTTLVDVLRRLLPGAGLPEPGFLSDRRRDRGLVQALDGPRPRWIVAELSVSELRGLCRFEPDRLVVTQLAEVHNHVEYATRADYLEAKFGWIRSVGRAMRIAAGAGDLDWIRSALGPPAGGFPLVGWDTLPDAAVPVEGVSARIRWILEALGSGRLPGTAEIQAALREILLARGEWIAGQAVPVLDVGPCKNPDALLWTARALDPESRVISVRPLPTAAADLADGTVELLAPGRAQGRLEGAIARWRASRPGGWRGPVVIDAATRRVLFGARASACPGRTPVRGPCEAAEP